MEYTDELIDNIAAPISVVEKNNRFVCIIRTELSKIKGEDKDATIICRLNTLAREYEMGINAINVHEDNYYYKVRIEYRDPLGNNFHFNKMITKK